MDISFEGKIPFEKADMLVHKLCPYYNVAWDMIIHFYNLFPIVIGYRCFGLLINSHKCNMNTLKITKPNSVFDINLFSDR